MQYNIEQEAAIRAVWALLADPVRKYLVIKGPAGTGKSEIIKEIVRNFDSQRRLIAKLTGDNNIASSIKVTAITNKAVDAIAIKGGVNPGLLCTTAKLIGARPINGDLVRTSKDIIYSSLIIVDECSYATHDLIEYLEKATDPRCKIIYLGDPYQLPPPKLDYAPVFDYGFDEVELTQIMRQDKDNPIQQLSLGLREFVKGGPLPKLVIDNKHIFLLNNEDEFIDTAIESFKSGVNTKLIGFRNELVINANAILKEEIEGKVSITKGDVLVVNKYLAHPIRQLKAESEVTVMDVYPNSRQFDVKGTKLILDAGISVFLPDNPMDKEHALDNARDTATRNAIDRYWADLRPAYACTIHKAQGSTYTNVFINLDELNGLDDLMLSRLLYVAVSRAKEKVYFMGSL